MGDTQAAKSLEGYKYRGIVVFNVDRASDILQVIRFSERHGLNAVISGGGDPLEVTTAAELVIIAGKPVDMVSRQTLLRDRYLPENTDMPRAYIKS
jgi:hypothetical protein